MIFRLFAAFIVFSFALIGTACGNVLRATLDRKYRKTYMTPDTDDLIMTGVLSNSIIASVIAIFTGSRRLWCAIVGGTVLTFMFGDRFDRNPEELTNIFKSEKAKSFSTPQQKSPKPTNGTAPSPQPSPTSEMATPEIET